MLTRKADQLIFAAFMGALAMSAVNMAMTDWKARADTGEEAHCKDRSPEFRALMVRAPGEAHSVEWCAQFMKFLSKDFVPEIGNPLPPEKNPLKPRQEGNK